MTVPEFLTTRNATLPDMVAMLRHQRARRLDVVAPAAAIHAHEGNLVISGAVQQMSDFRLSKEDVIEVSVWKEPELSRTVPIRPDGKITLPLIGEPWTVQ